MKSQKSKCRIAVALSRKNDLALTLTVDDVGFANFQIAFTSGARKIWIGLDAHTDFRSPHTIASATLYIALHIVFCMLPELPYAASLNRILG